MRDKYLNLTLALVFLFLGFSLCYSLSSYSGEYSEKEVQESPLSLDDVPCGHYKVAAQFQTLPSGEDTLVFYPQTGKEFTVYILGLTTEESLRFEQVKVLFEVSLPLDSKSGQKQGRLFFKKYLGPANQKQIFERPFIKLKDSCEKK